MNVSVDPHLYMHAGAVVSVVALAIPRQLSLRVLLFFGIALNTLYHFVEEPGPAWQEIFWNFVSLAINLWNIVLIVIDRSHFGMTADQETLFLAFGCLTPGEFRKFLKLAEWCKASEEEILTTFGVVPNRLYFVFDGQVEIRKSGRCFKIGPRSFIGEIAFLRETPASATVVVARGTRYIAWPRAALRQYLARRSSLEKSVLHLLSHDMALKVAND